MMYSLNRKKKLDLPWEYQALKLALFPLASAQCPDKQNAINLSGSDLNVAM